MAGNDDPNKFAPPVTQTGQVPSSLPSTLVGAGVVGGVVAAIAYAGDWETTLADAKWESLAKAVGGASKWVEGAGNSLIEALPDSVKIPDNMKAFINGRTVAALAAAAVGGITSYVFGSKNVTETAAAHIPHMMMHHDAPTIG